MTLSPAIAKWLPVVLLSLSNIFMTFAWYGHLKFKSAPLLAVIVVSWGIAFFEYCFQVPANRIGSAVFTLPQLKVIQEVIALIAFAALYVFLWKEKLSWDFAAAGLCLVGAVYFIFRG